MAKMAYNIIDDNDYYKFRACYDKLAIRAYNDSLGGRQNDTLFTTFKTEEQAVNNELKACGLATDYNTVENTMASLLNDLAGQTGIKNTTLQSAVELCFYNEGLWGLHDLGGRKYSHNKLENRTRNAFTISVDGYIAELEQAQSYSMQNNNERSL